MQNVTEIPPEPDEPPIELQNIRVATYCRVSTQQEEQDSSIEIQVQHYTQLLQNHPFWINAGVFSERITGLKEKDRHEYKTMLRQCRKGKIDLILTKSISRFGRNTLDMLKALRELRDLGVDVYFEKENLWLHERKLNMLLTAYCAFAQAESESASGSIKWGVKAGFRSGQSGYANFVCFGYKQGDNGKLEIDKPNAKIVRKIFELRASGASLGAISDWLYAHSVNSPTGKERWSRETISKLLRNEKYMGDVLLQKTFVQDLFSGKQIKNTGELNKYLIQSHHPAIVCVELFRKIFPDATGYK